MFSLRKIIEKLFWLEHVSFFFCVCMFKKKWSDLWVLECWVFLILVLLVLQITASGILMHCSSHNNILLVIHMIHSFCKVGLALDFFIFFFGLFLVSFWSPCGCVCSSINNKAATRGLCWTGEAGSWVWGLWIKRVWCVFLSLTIISYQMSNSQKYYTYFLLVDMHTNGKEMKQTKTFCELTQQQFHHGCFMH